jgi:hypothetical protein
MKELETYYKRNLPHYQPLGESFFITFRLKGTLPIEVINKLKREKEKELEKVSGYDDNKIKGEKYLEFKRKYFKLYDDYLDNALFRPKWLYDERVAGIVKEAIHHRDEKEYDLIAYCIMPNHVHLVITPIVENLLEIVNKDKIVERFAESLTRERGRDL